MEAMKMMAVSSVSVTAFDTPALALAPISDATIMIWWRTQWQSSRSVAILLLLAVALLCAYEVCAVYMTAGSTAPQRYLASGFFFGMSAIALAINMLFICRMVFNVFIIRNDLKLHTQQLKLGSTYKFKKPINLQIGHNGPVSRSRIKEQTEVEDGEFTTTLRKEELVNCTWLSISDDASSCSKDNGLFGYNMDLKIEDAWLISLLSTQAPNALLDTEITFFDGSRVNPIEEASLVLDQRRKLDENMVFQENLEEEEVVLWLKNECFGSEGYTQTLEKKSKSAYLTDTSEMVFQ